MVLVTTVERELDVGRDEVAAVPARAGSTAIPNPIRSAALSRPEHATLVAAGQTWSASDLLDAVTRCAGVLARAGVAAGQTVALAGPASAEWVVAFHALGWLGAAVAPLPTGGTPGELDAALAALAPSRLLLCHGLPAASRSALAARGGRFLTELEHGPEPAERFWPLEEVRAVVLTSGSTAAPRPVPLTTSQLLLSAFGSALRLGHDPEDRWLACLPLHHVGGLSILARCALYGTTVVLHDHFDPRRVARTLDAGDVTLVSLVPAMLERVLDAREARPFPTTLRAVLLGGDATPPALLERCRALGVPVALTWGMTEAASQVATRRPGDLDPTGGVGAALPFVRVTAEPAQPGDRGGRLVLRGPLVGPAPLLTRDRGAVVRGVVHVHGRDEDVIKSGGETVSLAEVEASVRALPGVADVAVVGVEHPRWGQRPVALVVPRRDVALDPATVREACRERLSPAKVPERVVLVDEVPRTQLGKLARPRALALATGEVSSPPPPPQLLAPRVPPRPEGESTGVAGPLEARETAAARAGAGSTAERLAGLRAWLGADLGSLERSLETLSRTAAIEDDPGTRRAARHLLLQPGKRLRPLCLLLAARLGDRGLDAQVSDLAVASELVHAATLLHDDVIDEGTERRGAPAARVIYGNSASVLAGDALFTEALRLVARAGCPGLLEELLAVIAEMVDAEALQLERRGRLDLSRQAYLRVIRGKTAALFRWVFRAGGVAAGLEATAVDALGEAGASLGLAFQLVDDILDLSGDPAVTGKDAFADLRQGKVTWPVIIACEREPDLRQHVAAIAAAGDDQVERDGDVVAARLTALLAGIEATRALAATRTQAEAYAGASRAALGTLPAGPARAALEALVDAAIERVK